MTGSIFSKDHARPEAGAAFALAAISSPSAPAAKKRPAPFSLRLSPEERARLERDAGDMPLGAYVRALVLTRSDARTNVDRSSLSAALARLGQSDIAGSLKRLADAAHRGAIDLTPEIEAELEHALAAVSEMRRTLMAALGLKQP